MTRTSLGIALLLATTVGLFSACGSSSGKNDSSSDAGKDAKGTACVVNSDCDDKDPCTLDFCVDNACKRVTAPDGDALEDEQGDCHKTVCKKGVAETIVDNGDVPDDDEPCTLDICTNGVPNHTNKLDNTLCTIGNGNGTCKGGICYVLCLPSNAASQCDDENPCTTDACLPCDKPECEGKGLCGHQGLSGMPTPGASQTVGDCLEHRCVEGKDEEVEDNYDAPDDGNECTVDLCKAGEPGHTPQSVGTACGGGSYKCDATGECVQCISVSDCSDYTGNKCNLVVCKDGNCSTNPAPAGTVCGTNGEECGADGSCCESCTSMGTECGTTSNGCGETLSCGSCPSGQTCYSNNCCTPKACPTNACGAQSDGCGGQITCPACASGQTCYNDYCCTPKSCTGGACGTTTDGCGNTITCPGCPSGQVCYSQNCCTPKTCTVGSCGTTSDGCGGTVSCGVCSAGDTCSSGTCGCFNGIKNGTETDVDCGGVCAKKCDQGLKCLAGSDCTTGNCVDGVCCDSPCTGTCKACTSALTGQTTGLCANVSDNTDPDNDCTFQSSSTCGTTGQCKAGGCEYYGATTECGVASCSGGIENKADKCNGAGSCVDGGQTACTAPYVCGATTCQSCSDGVKNGNEKGIDCGGGGGCPGCPPGNACSGAGDCANGLCVDGYCCNTTCTGLCMACNVSGVAGTCSPIAFGQDPLSECPGTKTCNGAGGCT